MDLFTQQAKAIADRTRIRMLKLLENGELCVCEIISVLKLGQSTASKHLGILKRAGLVESRKNGTWAYYRLPEGADSRCRGYLEFLAANLSDDEQIAGDRKILGQVKKKGCSVAPGPDDRAAAIRLPMRPVKARQPKGA
ncbi:MAG: metalloregulator ArsR/SmtB family transcription factor [Nitrospiraceae bacterium]|nr:metalloregulator ArsR/SmtB family transcription factor [Nitrospiraceae bacterium]